MRIMSSTSSGKDYSTDFDRMARAVLRRGLGASPELDRELAFPARPDGPELSLHALSFFAISKPLCGPAPGTPHGEELAAFYGMSAVTNMFTGLSHVTPIDGTAACPAR